MLRQLYTPFLLVILVSLIIIIWFSTGSLREFYLNQCAADLESRAYLLEGQINQHIAHMNFDSINGLCVSLGQKTSTRFTVILPSGQVVGDTDEDPLAMEDHSQREEIAAALRGQKGVSIRYSNTLQQNLMYVAVPSYHDGQLAAVIRSAFSISSIEKNLMAIKYKFALGGLLVAILAAIANLIISRRISRPLEELKEGARRFAEGDLGYRLPIPDTEEIKNLAETMNQMARQLDDRIRTVLRNQNEQQAMLSSMTEGILAFDKQEHLININQAALELFGIDKQEALGKSIQETIRNPEMQKMVSSALSSNEPVEKEIILTGNGEKYLQAHGTILRDGRGQAIGALVVLNDMTRLRMLEKVRRDFVANVSHELKTPITSIKGFVETLLDGALENSRDTHKFLEIVARQADRLNAIITDILSLSKIEQESERDEITLEYSCLKDVLRSAIQSCEIKAAEKSINVNLDCDSKIKAPISPHLLEQAVINLIDNAIKYSEPESTVEVACRKLDDKVEIFVSDQGCGLSPDHLPRVFERFYRVDKARSRKLGGTGLGLAIVKHIAMAHKGEVDVKSYPQKGSTFFIRLPLSNP